MTARVAYLSLGANLGDRPAQLADALRRLGQQPGVTLTAVSGLYETAPQGRTDQPDFLNCAAKVETTLAPLDLLAAIHAVERAMGRVRSERWGPRTIDLDILLYGDGPTDLPGLTVPHPRMWERAFVLIPLAELTADPQVHAALAALPDQGVRLLTSATSFHRRILGVE